MLNPVPPRGVSSHCCTSATTASGGASVTSRRPNDATSSASPSTSTVTPRGVFTTDPASPRRAAVTYTNGRKPTPCTTPETWKRRRTRVVRCLSGGAAPSGTRHHALRFRVAPAAHQLQPGHGSRGPRGIDPPHGEPHVDEPPFARLHREVLEHPEVHRPHRPQDVDAGQHPGVAVEHL